MLNKMLASIFVAGCLIGLQILVMTQGWGLRPQNWWWIIGGGIFGYAFLKAIGDKVLKTDA